MHTHCSWVIRAQSWEFMIKISYFSCVMWIKLKKIVKTRHKMLSKTKQHISIWLFSIIITYLRKQIRISFQKEDLLKSKSRQMSGCFLWRKKFLKIGSKLATTVFWEIHNAKTTFSQTIIKMGGGALKKTIHLWFREKKRHFSAFF